MDESKTRGVIRVAIISLVVLIAAGTVTFHHLEDWTWVESFYYTVVTLTTVGYGDLTPTSDVSRLVATFFILLGVGTVAGAIGTISSRRMTKRVKRRQKHD